ncbi:MAG: O-antigen ligase family protein [Elusimicrobia bacterium]|nr:O-antigen ligase family protein [Elusimicrobiota bacterium]
MQQKPDLRSLLSGALALFSVSVVFSVTAVEASLFLALLLLLALRRGEGSLRGVWPELRAHPLFVPWLAYIGVCLLTALAAYYPGKALGQLNSDFLKYVCFSTLLLAVRKEHLPRLSAFYAAAAAVSAVFALYEALSPLAAGGGLARAGVLMNAVRYGEAMSIALLLQLSLLLHGGGNADRRRYPLLLSAALTFAAVLLTQTRGAYLGLFVGALCLFAFSPASRKRLALAGGAMLLAAALLAALSPGVRNRVEASVAFRRGDFAANSASTGINVRLELWKLGYKMFRAHPALGVGPDNVKKVFKRFHPKPFPEEGIYGTLNNLYVHQAAERGSLGLAALLFLFWAMLRFARRRYGETASPYALWALCALPAFYVMNLTEISFQHVHTSFAIFLALAFAAAAGRNEA